MPDAGPRPIYFTSPAEWRDWPAEHHADASDVLVGFHRKHTGRQGMSWPEAVDEALCLSWIDTVVRRVDDERHRQPFTPRKARSTWSAGQHREGRTPHHRGQHGASAPRPERAAF